MATAAPKTIPIGYCGKKDEETDHLYGTGLVWNPGTVHDVPADKAALLLNHPDVWYDTRTPEVQAKKPVAPVAAAPKRTAEEEVTTAEVDLPRNFEELSIPELDAFSVRNFNISLDQTQPIEKLREEVRANVERTVKFGG